MSKEPPPDRNTTPSTIAALATSRLTGLSTSERNAGARAILRHQTHLSQNQTASAGLPLPYKNLHGRGGARGIELKDVKSVITETFRDVLDGITTLDSIDGGISVILRCPGYQPSTVLSIGNITVDTYVSSRELAEGDENFSKRVALLVQEFGAHLALPHLHRFQARCLSEGVKPLPSPAHGQAISVDGPWHLPTEAIPGSGHIRCRCRPTDNLAQDIALHKLDEPRALPKSKGTQGKIDEQALLGMAPGGFDDLRPPSSLLLRRSATSTVNPAQAEGTIDITEEPIISLGPRTDAILDRFELDDTLIPKLRNMIKTVRSTRWEAVLRTPEWGLSFEQAVSLAKALRQDIRANSKPSTSLGKITYFLVAAAILPAFFLFLLFL